VQEERASALLIAALDENGRVMEGIMDLEISDEIRSRTTQCPFGFKCLEVGTNLLCPVERYLQGNGLFLRKNKRNDCPYLMAFGQQYICNCPTHVDLHLQYNI
jgi:hypothetical protein